MQGRSRGLTTELSRLIIAEVIRQADPREVKAALGSCSLVCQSWEDVARTFLFHQFILKITRNNHPVLDELFELLRTSRTRFGRHIRFLHLDGEWWDHNPTSSGRHYDRSPAIDPQALQILIPHLPRLHSLFLTNIRLVSINSGLRITPFMRPAISRLEIFAEVAEDDDITDIFHVIYGFSSIKTLSLHFTYSGPLEILRPNPETLPIYLGSVNVGALLFRDLLSPWARPIHDFLRKVQGPRKNNFDSVCFWPDKTLEGAGTFLRMVGPDVRSLRLNTVPMFTHNHHDIQSKWGQLGFASCSAVEAILLDYECRRYSGMQFMLAMGIVFRTYLAALQLPEVRALPKLNRVILRVTLHSIMHPIFVQDWDAMDRALDALPGLDTVIVSFTFDSLTEPSFFQLYMPRMQAKGRLVFCIDEDEALWTETDVSSIPVAPPALAR